MERKINNDGRILETAYNIIEQVNNLLVSAANPSDETSLSIRLSLIKVSSHMFGERLFYYLIRICIRTITDVAKNLLYLFLFFKYIRIFSL